MSIFNNASLTKFIRDLGIDEEKKSFLLSKLPTMDLEERGKLLKVLTQTYILDLEEKKAIERMKKYWNI